MIPTAFTVVIPALLAGLFFAGLGFPLARLALPRGLALGVSPALGWAVFSVCALALFSVLPFTTIDVLGFCALSMAASLSLLRVRPAPPAAACPLPAWAFAVAGVLAAAPAIAIFPKHADGGLLLGPPMYDHVKVAIIDAITRQKMPPANPFFGPPGAPAPLAYYYLWHFSAAVLSSAARVGGWSADNAMTWFTAFASVLLMMGLAVHVTLRRHAAWMVACLCLPASLRPVLNLCGPHAGLLMGVTADLGAWMNQASWVPQHLAGGCCVVLSALLIAEIASRGSWAAVLVLPVTVAAGFESSVWVGGIAFAAAAALAAPVLLWHMPAPARRRFILQSGVAALLAAALIAPFCVTLASGMAAKQAGVPIAVLPYRALDLGLSGALREVVDLAAYWLVVLPFNFPALLPAGLIGGIYLLRAGGRWTRDPLLLVLGCFAIACLAVTWLLRSTIDNNDLGWRAVIPSLLILAVFAAAAWSRWLRGGARAMPFVAAAGLLACLGLPQQAVKLRQYGFGQVPADAAGFAQSADLWRAVRVFAAPGDRVANNPQAFTSLTYWPDNISWALFADRPSCYAGRATAIAYANLSPPALAQTDALFRRVFAGHAEAGDVAAMAARYGCRVVAVTPADGAWTHDPFATAADYRLVQTMPGRWRIYQAVPHGG